MKDNKRSSLSIVVPKDAEELFGFIKIRDRRTKAPLAFSGTDAILTEMAALHYDLKIGDTFTLENSSGTDAVFTLSGIAENRPCLHNNSCEHGHSQPSGSGQLCHSLARQGKCAGGGI